MLECKDIDALMLDWLYQELDPARAEGVAAHVGGCARCGAEASALRQTREAMRGLALEEPPAALSAILLHEAARRAPARSTAAVHEGSFAARLRSWFQPLFAHPAAAAVATFAIVAGVAGVLYVRGGDDLTETGRPVSSSAPAPAASVPAASVPADEGAPAGAAIATPTAPELSRQEAAAPEPTTGYRAGLLDGEKKAALERALDEQEEAQASGAADGEGLGGKGHQGNRQALKKKRADKLDTDGPALDQHKDGSAFDRRKKEAPPPTPQLVPQANAVSGADALASGGQTQTRADDSTRAAGATSPGATSPLASRAPNREAVEQKQGEKFRPYRDRKPPSPAELKWLGGQEAKLSSAVKAKRCNEAASIANDILDRNYDYYVDRVAGSKVAQPCQMAVSNETRRRQVSRSRNVGGAASQAAPAKQKATEAPENDAASSD